MSRAFVVGVLTLVAAAVRFAPDAAAARSTPTAFLGFRTLGLSDEEARQLEQSVQRALAADRELGVAYRRNLDAIARCNADLRCYCRTAREQRFAQAIYGNVGRIEAIYSFELVLVDAQDCSVDNTVFVTEAHDPQSARARIPELTAQLLKPQASVSKTAVKVERDVQDVPAVVTVVPRKQIEQLGLADLSTVLRLVPGFEILDTNSGDIVLHHGLTSTVLYMFDGIPLSNPKFNFATLGKDISIGIDHAERIELVRGPASVLWGQNAFLGIINVIPRMEPSERETVRARVRLGTLDTQEIFASIGATRPWLAYYVGTSFKRSAGPRTRVDNSIFVDPGEDVGPPVWGNGGTTDNEADTYFDVIAKARLARRLEILFHYISQMTYYEISPFGSLLRPDDRGFWDVSEWLYAISWTDELAHGFGYRLAASRYEHRSWEYFVVYPKKEPELPFGFSSLQGNELRPEINHLVEGRLYHTIGRGRVTNRAQVGLSFLHQQMPSQFATLTTGDEAGREALDIEDNSFVTVSAYAHDDLSLLSDRLVLSGGVRYDHHDPFQSAVSVQGALIGGTERLRGKLVYAEGFRPPEMNSLYSTTGTLGNPALRPERSRGVLLELSTKPLPPVTIRLGGTVAFLSDLIKFEQVTDPALQDQGFVNQPVNRASTYVYGGDAELILNWSRVSGFVNYSFKHLQSDEPLPFANHTASGGISLRPLNDFNAFATASFVSPYTVRVLRPPREEYRESVDPRLVTEVGLTISNLLGMFDFTAKVRNPIRYSYHLPYQVDGRTNMLLERRQHTEALFSLSWAGRVPGK